MPLTLHLIRHAAHALLPHTLAGRQPGVALSEEGRVQAAVLAHRFRGRPVSAVISSPVQRARETAAPLAEALALGVTEDEGWEELDFGAWTGQRFDELERDPAWRRWNRSRLVAAPPGGETMYQAQARTLAALSLLFERWPDAEIAVVSHADIIKATLAPALGLSLDLLHRITIDPASVSTLVVFDRDVRVDCLNG